MYDAAKEPNFPTIIIYPEKIEKSKLKEKEKKGNSRAEPNYDLCLINDHRLHLSFFLSQLFFESLLKLFPSFFLISRNF